MFRGRVFWIEDPTWPVPPEKHGTKRRHSVDGGKNPAPTGGGDVDGVADELAGPDPADVLPTGLDDPSVYTFRGSERLLDRCEVFVFRDSRGERCYTSQFSDGVGTLV